MGCEEFGQQLCVSISALYGTPLVDIGRFISFIEASPVAIDVQARQFGGVVLGYSPKRTEPGLVYGRIRVDLTNGALYMHQLHWRPRIPRQHLSEFPVPQISTDGECIVLACILSIRPPSYLI